MARGVKLPETGECFDYQFEVVSKAPMAVERSQSRRGYPKIAVLRYVSGENTSATMRYWHIQKRRHHQTPIFWFIGVHMQCNQD